MTEQRIDFDGLRMVQRAVEEAPAERVDMSSWTCLTTACAIGTFCQKHPSDRLQIRLTSKRDGLPAPFLVTDDGFPSCWNDIDGDQGFSPVAARFRISFEAAVFLFHPSEYGLPSQHKAQFLARLAQFIADHEPKPSVEVKADAAFMRSLDPVAARTAEDDAGAAMAGDRWDGQG
jgi:hypothetical protein